ncbi:MAG TPA: thioester domain-containing protein [Acidimicrobiales bacterium]
MITALRQRRRRRASTVAASLAAAAGLVVAIAAPAAAASQAELLGSADGESGPVHGTAGDTTRSWGGGLFDVLIDGEVESKAYCIDIHTGIDEGADLDEVDWDTSGVANLAKVEAILRWYYPNGNGPDDHQLGGSNEDKARATQAAIWHYTDGFELTEGDPNSDAVVDNYTTILAAVEDGLEGFGEPTVTLSITPPADTAGDVGGLVGPYVVNTTATSVTLTPSDGVTLHNEDGSPFTGTVADGTEVWLKSAHAGSGTITATAEAVASAGRVFYTKGQQRLILADSVKTDAEARAEVSFTDVPSTTSSSVPETTTSTVEETTTTTVPDTTTTVPETTTTTEQPGGGLPVTGAQSLVLVGVAAVLLAVGAGFAIVSRRKRLDG